MNDLGLNMDQAITWFRQLQNDPFVLIEVDEASARTWAGALGVPVRRCYITDAHLEERSAITGLTRAEVLDSIFPDPGPIMSGDFGEILVYIFHAARSDHRFIVSPEKWRLKEARTKAAPYSDVIHFFLPSWPTATSEDALICSEVKSKAKKRSSYSPINNAIEGLKKDHTSRLAKTLNWLRDRAISDGIEGISIQHLERFINATDFPPASKTFNAVAIINSTLLLEEIPDAQTSLGVGFNLIVISVADLYDVYMEVFRSAKESVSGTAATTAQQGPP